jgi:hypothetical protein
MGEEEIAHVTGLTVPMIAASCERHKRRPPLCWRIGYENCSSRFALPESA